MNEIKCSPGPYWRDKLTGKDAETDHDDLEANQPPFSFGHSTRTKYKKKKKKINVVVLPFSCKC